MYEVKSRPHFFLKFLSAKQNLSNIKNYNTKAYIWNLERWYKEFICRTEMEKQK